MSTLSTISPRNKGPMISSTLRTYAVTFPRQLAPTMGPALAGVEILEGVCKEWKDSSPDGSPEAGAEALHRRLKLGPRSRFCRIRISGPDRVYPHLHQQDGRIWARAR